MTTKNIILIAAGILLLTVVFIIFGGNENNQEQTEIENEQELLDEDILEEGGEEGDGRLEMQGFYIDIPDDYNCEGGYTLYRFLDASCTPKSGEDYEIIVDYGLPTAGLGDDRFVSARAQMGSYDLDGVCEVYSGEPKIELGAESFICNHTKDGKSYLTIGMTKSFDNHGVWLNSHLVRESDRDGEDVDRLVSFLNRAIDIDWDFFGGSQ